MIPFEPALAFTVGKLIVWYMGLILCGALGALGSALCKRLTNTKIVTGFLLGAGWYYCFTWIFQSKVSMEFGKIFNTVIKVTQ
jgi:hypothetical protein